MCNRQAACPAGDGRNIPSTYSVNVSKTKPLAGLKPVERRKTQRLALGQSIIPLCYFDQLWYIVADTGTPGTPGTRVPGGTGYARHLRNDSTTCIATD